MPARRCFGFSRPSDPARPSQPRLTFDQREWTEARCMQRGTHCVNAPGCPGGLSSCRHGQDLFGGVRAPLALRATPVATATPTRTPTRTPTATPTYTFTPSMTPTATPFVFYGVDDGGRVLSRDGALSLASNIGARILRAGISWKWIEPVQGEFHFERIDPFIFSNSFTATNAPIPSAKT